jgi:hypothetical protein
MVGGTASWHFLDVESGHLPEEASSSALPREGEGRIVVLGATQFARTGGWASRAVVSIAAAWAAEGRRIFLMDLGLDNPSLHKTLTLPNEEGVSDAFLYGASVQHIARPALDDAIFFASAGTATADSEEVLSHPRWHDLAGGFSETDATLLLFLPTEIQGGESILGLATDIIFLAAQGEPAEASLGSASVKVVATLGPLAVPQEGMGRAQVGAEPMAGEVLPAAGQQVVRDTPEGDEPDVQDRGLESGDGALVAEFQLAEGFLPPEGREDETPDLVLEPTLPQWGEDSGWQTGDDPGAVPDFGAEFADLPPLNDETDAHGDAVGRGGTGGGFGEDLLPGSGFGSSGPEAREREEGRFDSPVSGGTEAAVAREDRSRLRPVASPTTRPRPSRRQPPRKRSLGSMLIVILAVAAVSVAAAGTVLGVFTLPGLGFLQGLARDLPDPPLALPGPEPNEPLLRYSLELFRYHEEEIPYAEEMRTELRSRLPDLLFVLAPDESRGSVSYALLAGPAESLIDVENLRVALAGLITREDPESWRVRETPRAFFLGERGTLEEARESVASLEDRGISGYVLHATFPGGTDAYLILAGAYQGVADARPLQRILHQRGFRDAPLIERRGRLPG